MNILLQSKEEINQQKKLIMEYNLQLIPMVKGKIKLKDHYLKVKIMEVAVKNYLIISFLLTLFLIFI